MTSSRDTFLQTVRQAAALGGGLGRAPECQRPPNLGYQGAGPDPIRRFADEFQAVGGRFHSASTPGQVCAIVLELAQAASSSRILLSQSELLNRLNLADMLHKIGLNVWEEQPDSAGDGTTKETLFAADLGITGVDWLIAETGTIVLDSRPGQARSLSLLPPIHVAIAERRQLLPDLFDLFEQYPGQPPDLPACITLITGPSKTGDIELRLVTGVHGPGEVHVILLDA